MKIIFYGVEMTEESMENGYSGPNINSPLKIVFIRAISTIFDYILHFDLL